MDLSAKITKSVCLYLESEGAVVGEYLERADLPSHLALDAEKWIPAHQVENFLDQVSKVHPDFYPKNVALSAPEIRGWGLLDQVLRILQSPSDIYENPKQFLSYFVKPDLSLEWIEKKDKNSSFKTELSTDEFPLVTDYLSGALEAVAKFSGGGDSQATWVGNTVALDWSQKQDSIFKDHEPLNYKPEVYKEAVAIIHKQQKELSHMKSQSLSEEPSIDVKEVMNSLSVLEDYFLRARQLVSLLKAESGNKKWFKEAMKRLNWNELQGLHAQKIQDIKNQIQGQKADQAEEQIDLQLM